MYSMNNFDELHPRTGAGRFTDKRGSSPETALPPAPQAVQFHETQREARGHDFYPPDFATWPAVNAHNDTPMNELPLYGHYFIGDTHFYVSEVDQDTSEAFVYTDYGHGIEGGFGYLSMADMEALAVPTDQGPQPLHRDEYFVPGTLTSQVIDKYAAR